MNTNIAKSHKDQEDDLLISFPIAKKDLGNFVSNLLGQKQSLERTYPIDFEIDHPWLVNLHECLEQRISQQAHSQLLNFKAVIYFNNGTKRSITTFESFRAYVETKPLVSIGIKVVWEYLVSFPNQAHPENQQISLSAFTRRENKETTKSILDIIFDSSRDSTDAFLNIQIDHTERTWGDDVENVISSCVEDIHIRKTTKTKFFKLSRLLFVLAVLLSMMVYPLYSSVTTNSELSVSLNELYEPLKDQVLIDVALINSKIDLVYEAVSSFEQKRNDKNLQAFFAAFLIPLSLVIFMFFTKSTTNSYILLTKKARELKAKNDKNAKRKVAIVILSYLASIIAGIIATYGFNFLNAS
ncbi:hypothetical protein ACMYQ1_18410 [Shewanella oncorhynchi]|uniref:hypothetical protein n=1 Tax=Shewanella oncorhynchi TaxID=2726434 RepID=UPI0039EDF35C